MSVHTKDGAWISTERVVRLSCSKCGQGLMTSMHPLNDREEQDMIREHAEEHGGVSRG